MPGQRLIPYKGLDLDKSLSYFKPEFARFIKNLVYVITDSSQVTNNQGGNTGIFRPFESNGKFDISFVLPSGKNQCAGFYVSRDTAQVIFLNWNSNSEHGVYIIDGENQTVQKCYQKDCLALIRKPENFIHEGGATLEIFDFTDPTTELPRRRSYFMYTDGSNYQRFICLEDSIATNSFNESQFPHFISEWDKCDWINCGVPTPDCPSIEEVPNDDPTLPNYLKFKTWQFRIQYVDVYGRPSEWGKISELYVPGLNDCISTSELLPRCLNLIFDAGSPFIDKINIAFRNCNDTQWSLNTTLFLYKGSCLGDWWQRQRNPDVQYDANTNIITYNFCNDKECVPIPPSETTRTENPIPRVSQSLSKIGNVLGMANNKHGFNPVPVDEITLTVTPPTPTGTNTALVEIYVPVINIQLQSYQPVYRIDDSKFVWGGKAKNSPLYVAGISDNYKQHFGTDDQAGFIGYLAGTGSPNSALSELYYADETTNEFIKVEDYSIIFNPPYGNRRWYHKFTFANVPKAKYKFRIASHLAKTTDEAWPSTSTYVYGSFAWNNKTTVFNNQLAQNFGAVDLAKELLIDVCDGDYNSVNDTKVLAIFDLTFPVLEVSSASTATSGYIYEKKDSVTNEYETPVELISVTANKHGNPARITSVFTDHNGFYFTADSDKNYFVEFFGNCGCNNYKKLISFQTGSSPALEQQNFEIREGCNNYPELLCRHTLIKGKVTLCGTDIPVPGVGVVLSRGGVSVTGADGTFTIIAHPDNTQPQKTRVDYIYFVPTICPWLSCENGCLEPIEVIMPPCSECLETIINIPEQQVQFKEVKGLLSGGRYGVAIELEDWLGRHTYAQTKNSFYKTLPTITEVQSFDPSSLSLNIPLSVTFPAYFKKINILITKELSLADYITWIVDKVEFVDNTGNVNDVAPTQIKIYYASLNEYNSQNNFNTTTGWQFVNTAVTPNVNYTSDYVEFYVNGDGQFFPKLIRSLVKYDQTGQYFLIDYDSALKDLKKYAQMRLCRPSECNSEDEFWSLCGSVNLVNGKPEINTIPITGFDTYYKYRQIPIPIGTVDEPENIPITLGIPFEHNSPSDFWGYHCINIGRPNVRNPYECEIIRENQIALSGALSANGQLNYLNWFDEEQMTNFDSWNFQGIVSMIWETAIGLIICQNNNFTLGYNDNIVRVNSNGQIVVPSAADKFGKPNIKIGNNYGCQLFDKNTIRSWQGLVHWLDTKEGVVIQHNYDDAKPVSLFNAVSGVEGGIDSWLRPKIAYIKEWNKTHEDKKYWIGGIDPAAKAYVLTDCLINTTEVVNNERAIMIEKQETIIFDIYNKIWKTFASFVPEMYAMLQSNTLNQQFFSFVNGIPYKHYSASESKTYNTFYGVKCSRVLRVVSVHDAFQKKIWKNITNVSKTLWFSDKIVTDTNQETRILKAGWRQGLFYYSAAIPANLLTPNDINTPDRDANKLFEGDVMYGSWLDIRMIGDPDLDDQYTELYGLITDLDPDEKVLSS